MKYRLLNKWLACGLGAVCSAFTARAQSYYPNWSSYVGGDWDSDSARAIAVDSQTNICLGGWLGGGGVTIQNEQMRRVSEPPYTWDCGARDGFVAKVNAAGDIVWYVCLGRLEDDAVNAVAVHTNAAVYAAGCMNRTELEPDTGTDAFLTALSGSDGHDLWHAMIGSVGGTNAFNAVAVDSNGYIYAVGYTTVSNLSALAGYQVGGVTYGNALKGGTDAFVAKYAPNGTRLWVHYLGGANADAATACVIGPGGVVYVGGETRSPGWTTVGSGTPSSANPDGFVAKLTADGSHVWSALIGGSAADAVHALARDPATNALYLGGGTASTNFLAGAARLNQPSVNLSPVYPDGFVLRLTDLGSSFQTNWCRFAGGSDADRVDALAIEADGRLTAGGATASSGWLPAADNTYRGGVQDGFLLRLSPAGAPLWSTYVGGAKSDAVCAIAVAGVSLFTAGETFSPDNVSNWIYGGFWPDWTKDSNWDEQPDYDADLSYGLLASWTTEQGDPPAITQDPGDVTVNEGARVSFTVIATGYAPLTYYWYRNGAPVAGPTSNAYVVASAARTNNQDLYTCLVSNLFGTAVSQAARLTVISNATLTVTLAPGDAVAQGARWRLTGSSVWLASGASTNLPPGTYGVTFNAVTGWISPAAITGLALAEGQSAAMSGVYAAILPSAARTVTGQNVSLAVRAPAGLSTWSLVETLQADLTPTNISGGGIWNSINRTLTFNGSEAYTGTVTYAVQCVTDGVYTVSGTITSQPANQTVAVSGDERIIKGNFIRRIDGTTISITVTQPQSTVRWWLTEHLPAGLTVTNVTGPVEEIYEGGIDWYKRGVGEIVTYQVIGPPGTYTLSGKGVIGPGSPFESVLGDTVVTIAAPEPVPAPAILAFVPLAGTDLCALTFTSVVNRTYVILTNAAPGETNRWAVCLPVTGEAGATQRLLPRDGPRLFYRVRLQE